MQAPGAWFQYWTDTSVTGTPFLWQDPPWSGCTLEQFPQYEEMVTGSGAACELLRPASGPAGSKSSSVYVCTTTGSRQSPQASVSSFCRQHAFLPP